MQEPTIIIIIIIISDQGLSEPWFETHHMMHINLDLSTNLLCEFTNLLCEFGSLCSRGSTTVES